MLSSPFAYGIYLSVDVKNGPGQKIRARKKALGLSLRELAGRIGSISAMTLHRIETGKTSPSVSVLAEIAHHLAQPIEYFLKDPEPKIHITRKEEVSVAQSETMTLRLITPPWVRAKNVLVNLGEARRGKFIDSHTEKGFSLVYILEGECLFEHDGKQFNLKPGDVLFYNARYAHSVTSLSEKHIFISIFFKEDTPD